MSRYAIRAFFIILLFLIPIKSNFGETAYTPKAGNHERKAILDTLREGLRVSPGPHSDDFKYEGVPPDMKIVFLVEHLRIRDDWAWAEVTIRDYCCSSISALLRKEKESWKALQIVDPRFTPCHDPYENCIDVKGYIYKKAREKFHTVPPDIFPPVHKDRNAIVSALSKMNTPAGPLIFIVNYLKIIDNWAWIETSPRTIEACCLEPINALLYRNGEKWQIKGVQPCCGECEEDPYCAKWGYHRKLMKMFPSVPKEIFPAKSK